MRRRVTTGPQKQRRSKQKENESGVRMHIRRRKRERTRETNSSRGEGQQSHAAERRGETAKGSHVILGTTCSSKSECSPVSCFAGAWQNGRKVCAHALHIRYYRGNGKKVAGKYGEAARSSGPARRGLRSARTDGRAAKANPPERCVTAKVITGMQNVENVVVVPPCKRKLRRNKLVLRCRLPARRKP